MKSGIIIIQQKAPSYFKTGKFLINPPRSSARHNGILCRLLLKDLLWFQTELINFIRERFGIHKRISFRLGSDEIAMFFYRCLFFFFNYFNGMASNFILSMAAVNSMLHCWTFYFINLSALRLLMNFINWKVKTNQIKKE